MGSSVVGVSSTTAQGDGVRGGGSSVLIRAPNAEGRGVLMISGTIGNGEENIRSRPPLIFKKFRKEIVRKRMRMRLERGERGLAPTFAQAMMILHGPPTNMLEACAKLENRGLAKVGWVKEDWIEVERGGGAEANRTLKERGGIKFITGRENIREPTENRRGRRLINSI